MPGPNLLVLRAQGTGRVYELRGSTIAQQIGPVVNSETAALAETDQYNGFVARLDGALILFTGRGTSTLGLYTYLPDTNTWSKFLNLDSLSTSAITVDGHQNCGFCMVTGSNGHPYLIAAFRDAFNVLTWLRVNSPQSGSTLRAGLNYSTRPGGMSQIFAWKGQAWLCMSTSNAKSIYKFQSLNPVTGGQTFYAYPVGSPGSLHQAVFFSVDDRLFIIWALNNRDSGNAAIYEFTLGAWVATGQSVRFDRGLPVGGTQNGTGWANGTAWRVGDAAYLLVNGSNPSPATGAVNQGLGLYKITVATPGGPISVSEISNPVVPSAIRRGSSTLADQYRYVVKSFVDDQTNPASPVVYIVFCPESDNETSATLFRFVDDSTELVNEVSMPTTSSYGYPDTFWGSGHFLNGIETAGSKLVTGEMWTSVKGAAGVQINYVLYGDPLVVPHGPITPGGGAAAFELGETMTSSSGGSGTILEVYPTTGEVRLYGVTGTFLNGDTITQTTGANAGAFATQNAASSGGLADKTLRFRYFLSGTRTLGVPSTGICSLVAGSNTRGNIVGGNEIQNEIAEWGSQGELGPNPPGAVEWDFLSDGLSEASIAQIKIEVVRP